MPKTQESPRSAELHSVERATVLREGEAILAFVETFLSEWRSYYAKDLSDCARAASLRGISAHGEEYRRHCLYVHGVLEEIVGVFQGLREELGDLRNGPEKKSAAFLMLLSSAVLKLNSINPGTLPEDINFSVHVRFLSRPASSFQNIPVLSSIDFGFDKPRVNPFKSVLARLTFEQKGPEKDPAPCFPGLRNLPPVLVRSVLSDSNAFKSDYFRMSEEILPWLTVVSGAGDDIAKLIESSSPYPQHERLFRASCADHYGEESGL